MTTTTTSFLNAFSMIRVSVVLKMSCRPVSGLHTWQKDVLVCSVMEIMRVKWAYVLIAPQGSWNFQGSPIPHILFAYRLREWVRLCTRGYLSNTAFTVFYDADTDGDASVFLAACKGSLFTYDLACGNWWNRDSQSFILLEWCAFSLDVTAEYQ